MSIKSVKQFLSKVTEDQELQAELAAAMEAENDRQAATELGAKHGFQFTPEELGSEIANRQSEFQTKQSANELSEQELEAVAGGSVLGEAASIAASAAVDIALDQAKW